MANEKMVGSDVLLSLPELERLLASFRHQVEQLHGQREQLAQTVQKLQTELATHRETARQLQADRDKYKELARVYIDIADPIDDVISDFERMPPPEQCSTSEKVFVELDALQKKLTEPKSA